MDEYDKRRVPDVSGNVFAKNAVRKDAGKGRMDLEEMEKKIDKMARAEQARKRKKRSLEEIQKQLNAPKVAGLMEFIEHPPEECTKEEYEQKARELEQAFGKILEDYRVKNRRGQGTLRAKMENCERMIKG